MTADHHDRKLWERYFRSCSEIENANNSWKIVAIYCMEIINKTRGGIANEIWERGNGGQIEIPDEHHTILGLHLKPEKF